MLLIKPYLGCNLACSYCYEANYRSLVKPDMDYDLAAIFSQMEKHKHLPMTLHGGEPLCLPHKDVEKILAKSLELTGKSGIQTNGVNIDDRYIDMFERLKTNVGISFDGPGELSSGRMSLDNARKVEDTIYKLKREGVFVSLICVISQANAGDNDRFDKLKQWITSISTMGITGRINPVSGGSDFELPEKRLSEVYLDLARFCMENNFTWSPFTDIIKRLKGEDAVCVFMGCDPFHTDSVTAVLGDGSLANCMRANKTSVLIQMPARYPTRDEVLQETKQEDGGCMGCEFIDMCHGGCPSSAEDWRDRTPLCSLWKSLFGYYQNVLAFCGVEKPVPPSCEAKTPALTKGKGNHGDSGHGDAPHGDHSDIVHGDSGRR